MPRPVAVVVALALSSLLLAAGASSLPAAGAGARAAGAGLVVVAGENFWGSIAAQLAGNQASVHSIIVNPNTDPHAYEPAPSDAIAVAGAKLVIVNGIGYDNWLSQLIAANHVSGQVVLDVGSVLGLRDGDNPHQWYSPTSVQRVIAALVADFDRLDPAHRGYFAARERWFQTTALAQYNGLRAQIRARYAGVPVGYSESIFQPMGAALGLKLLTPYSFAKAIAEGTDVTAQDKRTVDEQAQRRLVKVWVFNSQNVTPDVQRVNQLAAAAHIPIATLTETLAPASDTFEQWQVAELRGLERALHAATGR